MCDDRHHHPKYMHGSFNFSPRDIARMKNMAGRFMRGFMGAGVPHNVEDLGDSYLITVLLAGRKKEDVQVSLIDNHLNVKAGKPVIPEYEGRETKNKSEEEEFCFPGHGFSFIEVDMDIPLPPDADTDSISSKMANGLLRITLGKKPAKHIDIHTEGSN